MSNMMSTGKGDTEPKPRLRLNENGLKKFPGGVMLAGVNLPVKNGKAQWTTMDALQLQTNQQIQGKIRTAENPEGIVDAEKYVESTKQVVWKSYGALEAGEDKKGMKLMNAVVDILVENKEVADQVEALNLLADKSGGYDNLCLTLGVDQTNTSKPSLIHRIFTTAAAVVSEASEGKSTYHVPAGVEYQAAIHATTAKTVDPKAGASMGPGENEVARKAATPAATPEKTSTMQGIKDGLGKSSAGNPPVSPENEAGAADSGAEAGDEGDENLPPADPSAKSGEDNAPATDQAPAGGENSPAPEVTEAPQADAAPPGVYPKVTEAPQAGAPSPLADKIAPEDMPVKGKAEDFVSTEPPQAPPEDIQNEQR